MASMIQSRAANIFSDDDEARTRQLIFVFLRFRADLMLLLCALFWGGTFVAIELAVDQMPPYLMVAIRFLVAALCFFPGFLYLRSRTGNQPSTDKAPESKILSSGFSLSIGPLAGLFLGLISFAGYGLQTQGLVYTTPARSAFITQLLVLFTFPMQIFFLRRRVVNGAYIGLVLVLAGAFFLLGTPEGDNWNKGDWLTIACAFSFALLITFLDVFSRRYSTADLTFYQILGTGLAAALASILGMDDPYLDGKGSLEFLGQQKWDLELLLSLTYLSIPATIGTVLIQVRFQKETSPARASLIYAMEPVFAGVFAFLILGQFLGWTESLGAAMIVSGVIVSEILSAKQANHNQGSANLKATQNPE
ncbi:MAG: DMT family transporter [Leptospiraceae bacterium]